MRLLRFAAGILPWPGGVRCVVTGGVTALRLHNTAQHSVGISMNIARDFELFSFPHFYAQQLFNTVPIFEQKFKKKQRELL